MQNKVAMRARPTLAARRPGEPSLAYVENRIRACSQTSGRVSHSTAICIGA